MIEPQTLARPYATAIFEQAKQQNQLNEWLNILALLAKIAEHAELGNWLKSSVSSEKKAQLLMQLLGPQPQEVRNAVTLLAEKKRLDLLAEIYHQYQNSKHLFEQMQTVQVRSAFPLTSAQQTSLQQALSKKIGRNIELVIEVDAALIGGLIIQVGDEVYDHSIKGQLHQLSQGLLTVAA
jgi:F-type H+-transporting ATPase subunit delta